MSANMDLKKEVKKKNLLYAAQELFLEKGVSKTSISEITERAQVAKGTFYLYFTDKEALLEQLLYQMSHDIIQQAYTYTEAHRVDNFAENVVIFADWIICYFTAHTDVLRLIKRNFSWPMIERSLSDRNADPLWVAITQRLHDASLPQVHSAQEQFNILYLIVELCGTVCYSSIIEHRPDSIEHMKPLLYSVIRRILAV